MKTTLLPRAVRRLSRAEIVRRPRVNLLPAVLYPPSSIFHLRVGEGRAPARPRWGISRLSAAVAGVVAGVLLLVAGAPSLPAQTNMPPPEMRTPKAPAAPRIHGPSVFGVRPGSPFLYRIPATGERPMEFAVEGLPAGLQVAPATGQLAGVLKEAGEHVVTLRARNARGAGEKRFRIVAGEEIALTPPLGWNSWNCWGSRVDAEKVLRSARGLAESGLIDHGWTHINIDDAWQGKRGGPFNAIQGNEKFPDMKGLCDTIHGLGLKVGIYSTPWVTSYANHIGGSAENPEGDWSPPTLPKRGNVNKTSIRTPSANRPSASPAKAASAFMPKTSRTARRPLACSISAWRPPRWPSPGRT